MSGFDSNNPFDPLSTVFNHHRYDNDRSSFDHHDHFARHIQYHHQTQMANRHFHNDSHRSQIDESYARAAREQTAQMIRNHDPMASLSILERLKRMFFSVD